MRKRWRFYLYWDEWSVIDIDENMFKFGKFPKILPPPFTFFPKDYLFNFCGFSTKVFLLKNTKKLAIFRAHIFVKIKRWLLRFLHIQTHLNFIFKKFFLWFMNYYYRWYYSGVSTSKLSTLTLSYNFELILSESEEFSY